MATQPTTTKSPSANSQSSSKVSPSKSPYRSADDAFLDYVIPRMEEMAAAKEAKADK